MHREWSGTEGRELVGDRAVKLIHLCHQQSGLLSCNVAPHRCKHSPSLPVCVSVESVCRCMGEEPHCATTHLYALSVSFSPSRLLGAHKEGIYPQSPRNNPSFKPLSPQATLLLCHSLGSAFGVCIIQVPASMLQFPFVYCKERKIFL